MEGDTASCSQQFRRLLPVVLERPPKEMAGLKQAPGRTGEAEASTDLDDNHNGALKSGSTNRLEVTQVTILEITDLEITEAIASDYTGRNADAIYPSSPVKSATCSNFSIPATATITSSVFSSLKLPAARVRNLLSNSSRGRGLWLSP